MKNNIKLKYLVKSIRTGLNPRDHFVLGEGDNFYVTTKNIDGLNVILDDKCDNITDNALRKINSRSRLKEGDILFSGIGTIGRTALITENPVNWNISESLYSLRANDRVFNKFLYYVLNNSKMEDYCLHYQTGSAQKGLRQEELKDFIVTVFDINTQNIISSFLDSKTKLIDDLVANIENDIKKMNEYRFALISDLTTKGFDQNVHTKRINVRYVDKIPEHWNCMKTLYALAMPITDGPHTTPELLDKGVPFVSAEAVSYGNGKIDFNHIRGYISESFYKICCRKYVPKLNDVYMIKSGATTGKVAIVDTEDKFTIWSPLAVYRSKKDVMIPKFCYYSLISNYYQKSVQDSWSFGTQQNIGMRSLEQIKMIIPPLKEQEKICSYLDSKILLIDKLISLKKQKIEKLKEYRKSLIYECTTRGDSACQMN